MFGTGPYVERVTTAFMNGRVDTKTGSMFTDGDVVYSYGYLWIIAHRVGDLILFNSNRYSVTTNNQSREVLSKIPKDKLVYYAPGDNSHKACPESVLRAVEEHLADLAYDFLKGNQLSETFIDVIADPKKVLAGLINDSTKRYLETSTKKKLNSILFQAKQCPLLRELSRRAAGKAPLKKSLLKKCTGQEGMPEWMKRKSRIIKFIEEVKTKGTLAAAVKMGIYDNNRLLLRLRNDNSLAAAIEEYFNN